MIHWHLWGLAPVDFVLGIPYDLIEPKALRPEIIGLFMGLISVLQEFFLLMVDGLNHVKLTSLVKIGNDLFKIDQFRTCNIGLLIEGINRVKHPLLSLNDVTLDDLSNLNVVHVNEEDYLASAEQLVKESRNAPSYVKSVRDIVSLFWE